MIRGIDRVGIGVRDLDSAIEIYTKRLGFKVDKIYENEVEKVRTAVIFSDGCILELIQPLSDDSPVAKFLAKRGEGVNYISLKVEDLDRAINEFKARGLRVLREIPTTIEGRKYTFLHPKDTTGVLFEITGP
jgi:methylmalonyl-CoA/ethylmalonyl-CoA epimerase